MRCRTLPGRFTVHEIEIAQGTVVRFAADFVQYCGALDPALYGSVRFNSSVSSLAPFGGQYPVYALTLTPPVGGRI